jgi:hypothetical protein
MSFFLSTCGFVADDKGQRFWALRGWRSEHIAGRREKSLQRCSRHGWVFCDFF